MATGTLKKRLILDYGRTGLEIEVPKAVTTVIEPTHVPGATDPADLLRQAVEKPTNSRPLRDCVSKGQRVAISVCDITRPQPRAEMLSAIFEALPHIPPEDFVILIATGTHRANTEAELVDMLGAEIAGNYLILNHDGRDTTSLIRLPDAGNGVPVLLNRAWVEADVRITTGFVEPHLFAGFSGGPKLVAPGLAGLETIMVLHSSDRIRHPNAIWGITHGNPIHDDIRAISQATGVDFSIDVVLNRDKQITGVFAGELFAEHALACERAKACAMQAVDAPFEVVVTTNSGYPLDQNLYQSVKGIRAAHRVVAEGGSIICAAECSEGLPEHGSFSELLGRRGSPAELLEMIDAPDFGVPDQWQVQVQALVQMRAQVYLKSEGLTQEQVARAHMLPADDVSETIERTLRDAGPDARLCVLPQGPQTIPFVA